MSRYLHILAARAAGAPAPSTVRVRRALRFPPPLPGALENGIAGDEGATPGRAAIEATPPLPIRPTRRDDVRPAEPRAEPRTEIRPAERHSSADGPAMPAASEARAPSRDTPTPAPDPARARDEAIVAAVQSSLGRPEAEARPAATPSAAVRLRLPLRLAASAPSVASADPRIEVRIGRVEVRRPVAAEPPRRPQPEAALARTASRGLDGLAAARRYVDRLVH